MALGANVAYYGARAATTTTSSRSSRNILTDNDASIVTNSWGQPTFVVIDGVLYITIDENLVNAYDSIFKQGDVQGIGFYFSSGDNGDD